MAFIHDDEPDRQHCKQGSMSIPIFLISVYTSNTTVRASCVSFRDMHAEGQLDCMDDVKETHGRQRLSLKAASD